MYFIKYYYKKIILFSLIAIIFIFGTLQIKHLLVVNEEKAGFTEKLEEDCVIQQCTQINYGFNHPVYLTQIKKGEKTVYESLDKDIYLKCKDLSKNKNIFTTKIAINNKNTDNIKILDISNIKIVEIKNKDANKNSNIKIFGK